MAHVAQWKKDVVLDLSNKLLSSNIIGIVNLDNLPSRELQEMRKNLRDDVDLIVSRKSLMKLALEEAEKKKSSIKDLEPYLNGVVGFLLTEKNPFKVMKTLNQNKTKTFAKIGEVASSDVFVRKGPTSFSPGPIISELAKFGLKTGVEGGKVSIKEDKVVVKEGDTFSEDMVSLLKRLDIKPAEIGLNLVAVYEDGVIFDKKVLNVDESVYISMIENASRQAFNLAFNSGYPTKEVIEPLIITLQREAKSLAVETCVFNNDSINDIVIKAQRIALGFNSNVD